MPLVGLIDDSNEFIDWNDVEKGKGDFSDPVPMLLAMKPRDRSQFDFSVTEIMGDPYQVQMTERYDYYESPSDLMDRLLGSAWHALMESSGVLDGSLREERQFITVKIGNKNYTLGGMPDLVEKNILWDYKTVTVGKLKMIQQGRADAVSTYTKQLNIYRYLLNKNGTKGIKKLRIRAVVRDWRFYEFRNKGFNVLQYPRGVIIPIEKMAFADVGEYIRERMTLHVEAGRLSDEELHKAGECDTWRGLRCEHYCAVSDICHFRRNDK